MNITVLRLAAVSLVIPWSVCSAQVMYRCGNTFSQQPCSADAKTMDIPSPGDCSEWTMRNSPYCIEKENKKAKLESEERRRIENKERGEKWDREAAKEREQADTLAKYKKQLDEQSAAAKKQIDEKIRQAPTTAQKILANKRTCLNSIRLGLKDPGSAQFTEVERSAPAVDFSASGQVRATVWYSLAVNAKNSFGAYVGAKQHICVFNLNEDSLIALREN